MQLLGILAEADSFLKNGKHAFLIGCFSLPPLLLLCNRNCFSLNALTKRKDFSSMDCSKSCDLGLSNSSYS